MKHFKLITVIMALMLFLTACNGKPASMDEKTYNLGTKALKIMDDYNNMDIGKDEAYEQLNDIYDRLKSMEYGDNELSEDIQNGAVRSSILSYIVEMDSGADLYKSADKLREQLNK